MEGLAKDPLTRRDLAVLAASCLIFFGAYLVHAQTLNIHETVHCQNVREMLADGDWIVPHYGGRPWLERPPLPFWLTLPFIAILGDADWVFLLPHLLLGTVIVVLTAWLATLWFGRTVGVLSGLMLMTMQEFVRYATKAECDLFLCALVTGALCLFVKSEFASPGIEDARRFLGRRPWPVLGFFVLLGLTNLTKGLLFGTLVTLAPVIGYLLLARRSSIRRYLWLWGWLAFAAIALPWPLAVLWRMPDAMDFWQSDYLERAFTEAPRENWYYLLQLPWILAPWPVFAFLGAWLLRPARKLETNSGRWFLLAWAVLPVLGLSLSRHKHHHYLLHVLAPWSVYSAVGALRVWQGMQQAPAWLRNPLAGLALVGLPGLAALWAFAERLPVPAWQVPILAGLWLAFAAVLWWGVASPRQVVAFGTVVIVAACLQRGIALFEALYLDKYQNDLGFLREACATVPQEKTLLFNGEDGALVPSWWMHHSRGRIQVLHNLTYLRDDQLDRQEVYLIGRRGIEARLLPYGSAEVVLQSAGSRGETSTGERYTLFRLRYDPLLERRPANARVSPLQAALRLPGPFLGQE